MTDSASSAPTASPDHTGTSDAPGYTLWSVLRCDPTRPTVSGDLESAIAAVEAKGVTIRGFYDVSSMRADADLMIWMHGPVPEDLQWALRELRRTELLSGLLPTWNAMGVHREAEFNRSHVPAFLRGKAPEAWLTVYPFDRSYDWYILPEDDRKRMLADHGRKGSEFRTVLTNTVAAFALGDYEWILPLEAPELIDLVDLMRALRATEARLHVRNEVPFYTGRRIEPSEIIEVLS